MTGLPSDTDHVTLAGNAPYWGARHNRPVGPLAAPAAEAPRPDDGCRTLWQSVVMQALYDATVLPHNKLPKRSRASAWAKAAHNRAVAWLSNPRRRDFVDVCTMAGLPPDAVYHTFLVFQKDPTAARSVINDYLIARSHVTLENANVDRPLP